ncbi:MAG TPA: nucleotide exchange factor GrpE, partial [Nitrososphaera sp.]|nr:nucleotide exchange factor GrpE [Nitrososphaera sp.]
MSDDISYEEMNEKDGDELGPKDKLKRLRDELEQCKRERAEYLEGWQRAKADFVNARKAEEAARTEIVKYASAHVIEDMLEVLDTFDMAFAHKEAWEKVDRNWRIGVESIYQKMISQLESHGIKKIEPKVGEKFNPAIHQSVAAEPT